MESVQDEVNVDIDAILNMPIGENEGFAQYENGHRRLDKSIESIKRSGLVYLSRIPERMTVCDVENVFKQYGEIGRIYLKKDERQVKITRGQKAFRFTEGWVEFADKKVAKTVASLLNNKQVGGKSRKAPWYHDFWSIRYLPKFKWSHLKDENTQRQTFKRKHLIQEIQLGRKEADYLSECLKKSKRWEKQMKKQEGEDTNQTKSEYQIKQKDWIFHEKPISDELIRKLFNVKQ